MRAIAIAVLLPLVLTGAAKIWASRTDSLHLTIRVAIPPTPESSALLSNKTWTEFNRKSEWLRVEAVPVKDFYDSAKSLDDGRADIAWVRADAAMPEDAKSLAVVRTDRAFLIVPGGSKIESFGDIKPKSVVGIINSNPFKEMMLERILSYNGVLPETIRILRLKPSEVPEAVRKERLTAAFAVGVPGFGSNLEAFAAMRRATGKTPSIVAVDNAEALSARGAAFEAAEILIGSFPGGEPQPEESLMTVVIRHRLVTKDMSDWVAGEFVQRLYEVKSKLLATDPSAAALEAAPSEDVRFPVHPGAQAVYDGNPPLLYDRIESLLWTGALGLSLIGSIFTWTVRVSGAARGARQLSGSIAELIEQAREAEESELQALEDQLDALAAELAEHAMSGHLSAEGRAGCVIQLERARRALELRRPTSGLRAAV